MDLKQLRTFRAVAELGSLSKAADRLRAAQPALSRHIKLLEHELARRAVRPQRPRHALDQRRPDAARPHHGPDPPDRAGQRRSQVGQRQSVGPRHPRAGADGERRAVRTVCPPRHQRVSRRLAAHRGELWRASGRVAAPRRNGSRDHLWPGGRSASSGPVDRPRGYRRRRAAGVGPEQAEAGRPQMAGEAEADPAEHLARPAGAAGEGAGAREVEARRR